MMKMIYGKAERDKKPKGSISVFGCDPACSELDIKYFSGVVPQDNNLDEELNVWQNLSVFARFYKLDRKTAQTRIEELLDFMELSEKKKVPLRALSGGMKRRLIIARALLNNPRLLILDEPTTGLDPQVRHVIWDKIRSLKKQGMTVLLTTHYMEEAFQICDRIIIMDKGEKVMEGSPKRLLRENIEPYVLELAGGESMLKKISKTQLKKVRQDKTGDIIRLYADEADLLKTIARPLQSGEYVFRPSNLEDVFLKITGSELNALQ
jgi:lipooligosaccharide transport system ATP-binding protein